MAVQKYITPESDSNRGRYSILAHQANDGDIVLSGSSEPLPIEDVGELRLREGKIYAIGVVYDFATPLAAAASIDIGIAWPAGVTPTISFAGLCTGDAMGYLYEGASLSGGTPATPVSLNRNSTTASQAAVTIGPTVASTGTMILKQILIGGSGKKAGGGDVGSSNLILKPLTSYLVRLTNANGTAHAAEMILEWSE